MEERVYAGQTIGGNAATGTFSVPFTIYGPDGNRVRRLHGVVDTRRLESVVPRDVLEELAVAREGYRRFRREDGLVRQLGIAGVQMELDGKRSTIQVVFGDDPHETIVGSMTLACFALASDPNQERLVPGLLTL